MNVSARSTIPDPDVQIVHAAVKGRARFKIRALYRCELIKRHLEEALSQKEQIKQASGNTLTGTLLVLFECHDSPTAIASLIASLIDQHPGGTEKLQHSPAQLSVRTIQENTS